MGIAPLTIALEEIGRQSGLTLRWVPDLLPSDLRVTLQAERITVAEAVERVLDGTSLDLMVAPNGQAVGSESLNRRRSRSRLRR